jgi:hypothetical protein
MISYIIKAQLTNMWSVRKKGKLILISVDHQKIFFYIKIK